MKFSVVLGVLWIVLALMRIPDITHWTILPDGSSTGWWPQLGLRLVIASLFFEIANLKRRINKEIKL